MITLNASPGLDGLTWASATFIGATVETLSVIFANGERVVVIAQHILDGPICIVRADGQLLAHPSPGRWRNPLPRFGLRVTDVEDQ